MPSAFVADKNALELRPAHVYIAALTCRDSFMNQASIDGMTIETTLLPAGDYMATTQLSQTGLTAVLSLRYAGYVCGVQTNNKHKFHLSIRHQGSYLFFMHVGGVSISTLKILCVSPPTLTTNVVSLGHARLKDSVERAFLCRKDRTDESLHAQWVPLVCWWPLAWVRLQCCECLRQERQGGVMARALSNYDRSLGSGIIRAGRTASKTAGCSAAARHSATV